MLLNSSSPTYTMQLFAGNTVASKKLPSVSWKLYDEATCGNMLPQVELLSTCGNKLPVNFKGYHGAGKGIQYS